MGQNIGKHRLAERVDAKRFDSSVEGSGSEIKEPTVKRKRPLTRDRLLQVRILPCAFIFHPVHAVIIFQPYESVHEIKVDFINFVNKGGIYA
jgi:hypothetical protein